MKFKVGDKVKVVRCNYHTNCSCIGKEYVINTIENRKNPYGLVDCIELFRDDELELVQDKQFTKSNLKDGDKCTLKNGRVVYFSKDEKYSSNYNFDKLDKNMKYEYNDEVSIIKVERPTNYETVFERKEEILDETEKRYLRDVIRPFRKTVRYTEKEDNGQISRIKICFDYHFMFFPILEKEKKMYEGMKANRAYSIKELEL